MWARDLRVTLTWQGYRLPRLPQDILSDPTGVPRTPGIPLRPPYAPKDVPLAPNQPPKGVPKDLLTCPNLVRGLKNQGAPLWPLMGPCGPLWTPFGSLCGPLWSLCGPFWVLMAPCGPPKGSKIDRKSMPWPPWMPKRPPGCQSCRFLTHLGTHFG